MTPSTPFALTDRERQTYRDYARLALPRHTSYPIAPVWRDDYGAADFRRDLRAANGPFSLYVHIPFCEKLCYYCACTKEIVPAAKRRETDPAEALLDGLAREAQQVAALVKDAPVAQVHWGGGSPTFLTVSQIERLWRILHSVFRVAQDAEIAVEIDPRITSRAQLEMLRSLGFQRISMGIQDFAPAVQKAVNRLQSFEMVENAVRWCRELGFASVNFDLIYGLPFQTVETMATTLDQTLSLGPDRIAFYRLAVIPEIFRWQNVFHASDLPGGDVPLDLNLLAIQRFQQAGYEFLGLDHFARPEEALAQAYKDGTLQRNFQGMTTGKNLELIGLGPSAISQLDRAAAQNRKSTADWLHALEQDLPIERGLALSDDDRIRRELMQQLYGYGAIDKNELEARFGIEFDDYFASELTRVEELAGQGLTIADEKSIRLTPMLGRLLVRVVAAVFDRYLPPRAFREGLPASASSKVG